MILIIKLVAGVAVPLLIDVIDGPPRRSIGRSAVWTCGGAWIVRAAAAAPFTKAGGRGEVMVE